MNRFAWWQQPCVPIANDEHVADAFQSLQAMETLWNDQEQANTYVQQTLLQKENWRAPSAKETLTTRGAQTVSENERSQVQQFTMILADKASSKHIFELSLRQYREIQQLNRDHQAEVSNLMEIQSEEMLALSMDGTPEEIQSLVELHVSALASLASTQNETKAELTECQKLEYKKALDDQAHLTKAYTKKETIDRSSTVSSSEFHRSNAWKPYIGSNSLPGLFGLVSEERNGVQTKDLTISMAKTVGKRVIGPWIGLMPESLSLIGFGEEMLESGVQVPISVSDFIHVQLGSSLRVSFRIQAAISHSKPCNILELGKFEVWYAHAKAIYTVAKLDAMLVPVLSSGAKDDVSIACESSTEVHFPKLWRVSDVNATLHSNLYGAHVVIRASDVKSAILQADQLLSIGRVCIPLDLWSEKGISMLRKVKEALIECATRRFVSGSSLVEIIFLHSAPGISFEESSEWVEKTKSQMVEVFD